MKYAIGIDLGSGSIRAGAFALNGRLAASAARPTVSLAPDPARPDHIVWPHQTVWDSTCSVLREVVAALPAGGEIVAVASACLGMDGLPIDRNGTPLYDFIAWTDGRCVPFYEAWARSFGEDRQFLTTGTPARTFSTLFRLQWMAAHHPEIIARTHKWVLMADYINFRLCGALAIDHSMAACTLLFDPATLDWHQGVAQKAGVDTHILCDPLPSGTILGRVGAEGSAQTALAPGTPVVLGGHDYLCGVLPVGGHRTGTVVNVAGTWDVIQATVPEFTLPASAAGTGWTIEPHVAPGAFSAFGAAIGGGATAWFRKEFAADLADRAFFDLSLKAAGQQTGSLLFLPHLAGATGPVVDNAAAGAFLGLRTGHTRTDLLSAVFEGLNLQTRAILASASAFGVAPDRIVLVGGSARNAALVQAKADTLGLPIDLPDVAETTALGAAMLAALGIGEFATLDDAVAAMQPKMTRWEPDSGRMAQFTERSGLFDQAFDALRSVHATLTRCERPG